MNCLISLIIIILFMLPADCVLYANTSVQGNKEERHTNLTPDIIDGQWMLRDKIESFKKNQVHFKTFKATGLKKHDYLEVIKDQVLQMCKYQDEEGRIIDPVEKIEKYYSTPCYAHCVAVLAWSGHVKDKGLIESGLKALDVSLEDMLKGKMPGGHGDFYTYPVMFAYDLFKDFANEARGNRWAYILKNLDPQKVYKQYKSNRNNWNVVNLAGEYLRHKEGFTTINYVDECLEMQLSHFTENGMYDEHGNPMPYDLFARHYLSGILQKGYKGKQLSVYLELLFKGAWMSLFIQSPFGELPTGYRSSQHIWNEAEQCVIFEIYANALHSAGRKKEAAAFKRGAMLSLTALKQWIRPDGTGYVVKNKFGIEAKHGYESYSVHTCYNLLACSMLAQAWEFANDKIIELPAPADVGGFVIPLTKTFHKIIANNNGAYLEYDTRGDQKYNPTGIIRIQIREGHPQLGPSDGCASLYSGKENSYACGPAWLGKEGNWIRLAELQLQQSQFNILQENRDKVKFKISFETDNQNTITETITVHQGYIDVDNELTCTNKAIRLIWPMLIFDGEQKTEVTFKEDLVKLELNDRQMNLRITSPEGVKPYRPGIQLNHRNGIVDLAFMEVEGNKMSYRVGNK